MTATCRKAAISSAFGQAANYDRHATVQRLVAEALADRILALALPERPRILEIGCGTGFLSNALRRRIPAAEWVISDLSSSMVRACKGLLGDQPDMSFIVMDGENPCLASSSFDLICSSLAFQWFEDLPGSVRLLSELLAPGGHLAFSTMAADSFHEWRDAHEQLGLRAAIPDYPCVQTLGDTLAATVSDERFVQQYASARGFLQHLKGIGAHVPAAGYRPLAPGSLRRVMKYFEQHGAQATYHVAFGTFRRPLR